MIDGVEKQIYKTASKFPFSEKLETLLKTPNTIKVNLLLRHVLYRSIKIFKKT